MIRKFIECDNNLTRVCQTVDLKNNSSVRYFLFIMLSPYLPIRVSYVQKVTEDLRAFDYAAYKDVDLKRKFHKLAKPGVAALPDDKYRELEAAITAMESNYAKVHVCDYRNTTRCDLQLEPELEVILERSRDPAELRYYWQQWYDRAGAPTRKDFDTYVRLANEASVMNSECVTVNVRTRILCQMRAI